MDENAKFTEGRGSVRVDAHAMWPVSHFDSAATLHARRLWKLICRMDEITKRPWGQLAVRTWAQAHASDRKSVV